VGKPPKLLVYENLFFVNNTKTALCPGRRLCKPTHRVDTTYADVVSSTGAEFVEFSTLSTDVKKIKELIN